jgi:excisionase family DNA binding protein
MTRQQLLGYVSHGVPLEDYELTKVNHRWQQTLVEIDEHAKGLVAQWRAEEKADPELGERRFKQVQKAWDILLSHEAKPRDLMQWRVRLYCGHITETTRHRTTRSPVDHGGRSTSSCKECGLKPASIVAWESVGPAAPSPGAAATDRAAGRAKPGRAADPAGQQALPLRQVSERLNVSYGAARRLVVRGELRAVRVGRQWRVPVKALEDFLAPTDCPT